MSSPNVGAILEIDHHSKKGGRYRIFCQYCYRLRALLSSSAAKSHIVKNRAFRDVCVLKAKALRAFVYAPSRLRVLKAPLSELGATRSRVSCGKEGRGLHKETPKRQTFGSAKPDLICSLHCPATQPPALLPPSSYLPEAPQGSSRQRACRRGAAREWPPPPPSYFIPGTTPATVPCTRTMKGTI